MGRDKNNDKVKNDMVMNGNAQAPPAAPAAARRVTQYMQ